MAVRPPTEQMSSLRAGDTSAGSRLRTPQARFLFSGPIYWTVHPEPPPGTSHF